MPNLYKNKVIKSTGETLIDLTGDTVTAGTLLKDVTAHDRSGAEITGAVIVAPTDVTETSDTTPYIYKSSEHDAIYDELVGGSVAWNQLVANSGTSLSVTITSGHKYILKKSGTLSVGASSGSAITGLTGGTDWITDLTLMFGTTIADYVYSLEQSTAGSGIAWLKSYGFFTKNYYPYNAGGLISVNTSGKKVVSETAEITYPIQSTDLRGLYKLNGNKLYTDGDIYSSDGTVTRKYGIVDLGTLDWEYISEQSAFRTLSLSSSAKYGVNLICSKYVTARGIADRNKDKYIYYFDSYYGIYGLAIIDAAYSDATTFKTAMSGVYLVYELATPTTVTASSYTSPQMVYRNGTEEYLDTRDVSLPVGGNRKYIDIPDWMVNEYFDDLRAETSTISDIIKSCMPLSGGTMTGDIQFNVSSAAKALKTTSGNVEIEFDSSALHLSAADVSGQAAQHLADILLEYDIEADIAALLMGADNVSIGAANWETLISLDGNGISLTLPTNYATTSNLYIDNMKSGSGSEIVIGANGDVYKSSSSRDIKHDIQYIDDTDTYHDALMQIKPATYVYNNDTSETAKLGMIAEDIADVMPIAALTGEGGKVENYDTRAIIAMLVMEVQRLNAEIERLQGDSNAQGGCIWKN